MIAPSVLQTSVTAFDASLEVVWVFSESVSDPSAIVRDRKSGRLYHWPELRAWVGFDPEKLREAEIQVAAPPPKLVPRDIKHRREADQLRLF